LSIGMRRLPRWSVDAWMSIAVVALFLGVTFWWLTQDRSIPIFDAGVRLHQAIIVYEYLRSGEVGAALTTTTPYPPFAYLVGVLGMWIGGIGVAPPIIAANLVFVSLLALGCYNVGRLAFGPRAGLLAVIFALGSPLITAQFHVFMTDAPETAMVAVSVWLIIASERFSRIWMSALAGVAVGLGLVTKEPFAFFVAGVLCVTLARGGWRHWRGILAFASVACLIAMPWYVSQFSEVHGLAQAVASNQSATLGTAIAPHRWSLANLLWYSSNILDTQLYGPLFIFTIIGGAWTIVGLIRRRAISPLSWELTIGGFVAWLGITATFPHDTRYSMPLLLYLAVLGSGWIVILPRIWRSVAATVLVAVAVANMLSTSFGLGRTVQVKLPASVATFLSTPRLVTIYSNTGFLVAAPHRDGDMLGLMQALRRNGVREVQWTNLGPHEPVPGLTPDFSEAGLKVLAVIAGLGFSGESLEAGKWTMHDAFLGHGPITSAEAPPCTKLSDGSGVWVRLGNPDASGTKDYCPFHHPSFY
jgi:4-amino-4-deoxy-L-arabinose transferase-like glycosyltransferase